MPPQTRIHKGKFAENIFDESLFSAEALSESSGVDLALTYLSVVVYSCDVSQVLQSLLDKKGLFEYIYSIAEEHVVAVFDKVLINQFPTTSESFCESLVERFIQQLSLFFHFLPSNESHSVVDFSSVSRYLLVLKLLSQMNITQRSSEDEDDGEIPVIKFTTKSSSQKMMKRQRKRQKRALDGTIDPKVFESAELDFPESQKDIESCTEMMLGRLKTIQKIYLASLRNAERADLIREQYIQIEPEVIDGKVHLKGVTRTGPSTNDVSPSPIETIGDEHILTAGIKAELIIGNAKFLGDWPIYVSTRAEGQLREYRRQPKVFMSITKTMRELSRGRFTSHNQTRITDRKRSEEGVPIFEAAIPGKLSLIYQVDCLSDFGNDVEHQVIRIFGIYEQGNIDYKHWNTVQRFLARKGSEYKRRCEERHTLKPGSGIFTPCQWPGSSIAEQSGQNVDFLVDELDLRKLQEWIVLEKYIAFSQNLLFSILDQKDMAHVFHVSPAEREIVQHMSSCYVLGRSGTGKTTTMLFKILGIENSGKITFSEQRAKPRQLFVTKSHVLAKRVDEYSKKLLLSLEMSSNDRTPSAHPETHGETVDEALLLLDEEDNFRLDLPRKFSELEDHHFPLFLPFDKVLELLEADFDISCRPSSRANKGKNIEQNSIVTNEDDDPERLLFDTRLSHHTGHFIQFEDFQWDYWPRFPQDLRKGLDPASVFGEFVGVIEGSEDCLKFENHMLDRECYTNLSRRMQPTFATRRDSIYDLFTRYHKLKKARGDFDAADRSHEVISKFKKSTSFKGTVDFLYVDEVQDNLIIDTYLLRLLCPNPHGRFWAGDTAQTIARGCSFRFDDLRAFLHRFDAGATQCRNSKKIETKPAFFQLTVNYRSHGGIVDCASLIVELITQFWPYSIDALEKEQGLVPGIKPLFIESRTEGAGFEHFFRGEGPGGQALELGAEQCIIVRDDAARRRVRKLIGKSCIILTLYETKGLEFDDVLLFDFFSDSICDFSQWRVVYNVLNSPSTSAPQFDEVKHAGICSELKFLYVAVTRARRNLWIIDRSTKEIPMMDLLRSKSLIRVCSPEDAPKLSVKSSSNAWAERAKTFFENKRFTQAMHCYEQAGLLTEASIMEAYDLREKAKNFEGPRLSDRRNAFIVAAESFTKLPSLVSNRRSKLAYFRIAAECYLEAAKYKEAADHYLKAARYNDAALCYRKANLFDEALRVVQAKKDSVDPQTVHDIIHVCKLYYSREKNFSKARELFNSDDDLLLYMEERDLDISRAAFLESLGHYNEAAELHVSEGNNRDAIRLFMMGKNNKASSDQALECLLQELWSTVSFGLRSTKEQKEERRSLILLSKKYTFDSCDRTMREELEMFQRIDGETKESTLKQATEQHRKGNTSAALTLLELYFQLTFDDTDKIDRQTDVLSFLDACLIFVQNLRALLSLSDLCFNTHVEKMFKIRHQSEDAHFIPPTSPLYQQAPTGNVESNSHLHSNQEGVIFDRQQVDYLVKECLVSRTQNFMREEDDFYSKTFRDVCLQTAVLRRCWKEGCDREHIQAKDVDAQWFTMRLEAILTQIVIIHTSDFSSSQERYKRLRHWVNKFYEHCYPESTAFGNLTNILPTHAQKLTDGLRKIYQWINDLSFNYTPILYALSAVIETFDALSHQDAPHSRQICKRLPFFAPPNPSLYYENNYVPINLLNFLEAKSSSFIEDGIVFLRYIIFKRKFVHVGHLLRVIDFLCFAVAALSKIKQKYPFHNLILPKYAFVEVIEKVNPRRRYDTFSLSDLVGALRVLLKLLISQGNDGMITSDSSADPLALTHLKETAFLRLPDDEKLRRNIATERICRAIAFIGCNIDYDPVRTKILTTFQEVRRSGQNIGSGHYAHSFLLAKSWSDISLAVQDTNSSNSLNCLIQLICRKTGSRIATSKIKVLEFSDTDDLPNLITSIGPRIILPSKKLNASAPIFQPKIVTHRPLNVPLVAETQYDNFDSELDPSFNEIGEEQPDDLLTTTNEDNSKMESNIDSEAAQSMVSEALTLERNSVRIIKRNFLAFSEHKKLKNSSSPAAERYRIFLECLLHGKGSVLSSAKIRFYYFGLLPHTLTHLYYVNKRAFAEKLKWKAQLGQCGDSELEKAEGKQTMANEVLKQSIHLRKQLDPSRILETHNNVEKLREAVRSVNDLSSELRVPEGRQEFDIVLRVLFRVKAAETRRERKPELNTDDLYEV